MRRPLLWLLPFALGCPSSAPPDNTAVARHAVETANANWARLTAAGHADSLAEFYHTNAILMPPNMPAVQGKEAIRTFFALMNGMSSPAPTLALKADTVWGAGSWALERGRWTFTWPTGARRPPGAPAVDSGKYLVRWVQENGRWLMVEDIWNSDVAMEGAPTP